MYPFINLNSICFCFQQLLQSNVQGVALAVVIAFVGILVSSLNVIVAIIASCVLLLLNVNLCLILPTLAGKLGVRKTIFLPTPLLCRSEFDFF